MAAKDLPDVPRLLLLDQVARQGSIAGAAKAVGITASAVSQQLAALERETGVELLERGHRGVTLTGAGEALVGHARRVRTALESTRTAIDQLSGALVGNVRIGSIASAVNPFVVPTVQELAAGDGNITVTVTVDEPTKTIDAVINGELDIAIVDLYDHVPMTFPSYLEVTELLVEPLVLVLPPESSVSANAGLADLHDAHWVMPPASAACGQSVRYACRAEGFEPEVMWETDDQLLLVDLVSRGLGVTLLPRLAIADSVARVRLQAPAGAKLTRKILAVTRSSMTDRPVIQATIEAVRAQAGKGAQ